VQRLLPLRRRMARRYRRSDEPLDDLVQVATLGLIKAIDRFDPRARRVLLLRRADDARRAQALLPRQRLGGARPARDAGARDAGRQRRQGPVAPARAARRRPPEVGEQLELSTEQVLEAMEAASAYDAVSLESYRFGDEGDGETYAESIGVEDDRFELVEYGATIAPDARGAAARDRDRPATCGSWRT
jgi:RNA polymerase sigma-B factor